LGKEPDFCEDHARKSIITESNQQKLKKFVGILKVTDEKSKRRIWNQVYGSAPKFRETGTLLRGPEFRTVPYLVIKNLTPGEKNVIMNYLIMSSGATLSARN
jgi:hypothetical protein